MRLFVGVDCDGLAAGIADVQERFVGASGVRPVDPEGAHVTLEFLGDVDETALDELVDALDAAVAGAGVEPFRVTVGGLGAFPSADYIRVLWLGVREGARELTRLHEAIEARTTELGFEPAEHEFSPHVTIARMDHAGGKERVQGVLSAADPTVGSLRVAEVRLKESVRGEAGPEYATVERFAL
jgi:2'-5' RNA ligase